MKSIEFLRHAESAANAGLPSSDPGAIPLTEAGRLAADVRPDEKPFERD